MQLIPSIPRLRALHRDRAGLAMVEFALALPILLALLLYGLETINLVLAHMRISAITSMTADNASRVRDSIDEADINELMTGANLASGTYNLKTQGRIVLSALQMNDAKNGQWIRWQRCYGDLGGGSAYGATGKGEKDNSLQAMGPTGRQVAAVSGKSVMFVEVRYAYTPLIGAPWGSPRAISYISAFNVRKRPNADPTNTSGTTVANCS